jgi:hypothetical protein
VESFAIVEVVNDGTYITESSFTTWLGQVPVGVEVMDVRVYEPINPGSIQYEKSQIVIPLLVDDIRVGPMIDEHSNEVVPSKVELIESDIPPTRLAAGKKRYELKAASKQHIVGKLLRDDGYVEERCNQYQHTEDSSAWSCAHCTYINVTATRKCGMCSKNRQ